MKKLVVSLFMGIVALAAIQNSNADVIADWTFQTSASTNNIIGAGLTPGSTQSGILADIGTGTASAFHATAGTAWSIPAGNGSTNSWSANNWSVNDYFQFQVSTLTYSGIQISFDQTGSSSGPSQFTLQYSTDGSTFLTFGSPYTVLVSTWTPATYNSSFTHTFDLSSVTALDNASSVYFRLVDNSTTSIGGSTVGTGGTDRVDNFLVATVPEPSTLALAAFGGVAALLAFRRRH